MTPGLIREGSSDQFRDVAPDDLEPAPWQPRLAIDKEELGLLVASIREHGVLEPLLARPRAGGGYELLAGHRRLAAAREAGLARVPVRILDVDDRQAQAVTLTENLSREDLSPWEEAHGLAALRDAIDGVTQKRLAEMTGRSTGSVSESLTIADALGTDVQEAADLDLQTLKILPKTALHKASRGVNIAAKVRVLQAAARKLKDPAAPTPKTKGRPTKGYTFTDRLASDRGVSLTLRRHPTELEQDEARELLERLEPLLESLRRRVAE